LKFDSFWLSEFHNGSETKNGFQQLLIYKIFKHRKLPCIPCLGETHIKLQWYPSLFFFFCFATQLFSTPVRHLACTTKLRYLRSSAFCRQPKHVYYCWISICFLLFTTP